MTSKETIKFIIQNWNQIEKISSLLWKKIKKLFEHKEIGFIKRKKLFLSYYELSRNSFITRYAKYIIPTEYRAYLLESIAISNLYKKGKREEADKKRLELGKINPRALRIYNLYNSGILSSLFQEIDSLIKDKRKEDEIRGIISKKLDDLINDKSIIYVNLYDTTEDLYEKVRAYAIKNRYCLVYGSGTNTSKISYIFDRVIQDPKMINFEVKFSQRRIGGILHLNLAIFESDLLS